jgi:hypothetical protein
MVLIDVTDDASVAAAAKTIEAGGGLDVLVNNGGTHRHFCPRRSSTGAASRWHSQTSRASRCRAARPGWGSGPSANADAVRDSRQRRPEATMSEFDNLKNKAEQYAQKHPEQIKEGEESVEKKFGIGQQGPQDQGNDGQGGPGTSKARTSKARTSKARVSKARVRTGPDRTSRISTAGISSREINLPCKADARRRYGSRVPDSDPATSLRRRAACGCAASRVPPVKPSAAAQEPLSSVMTRSAARTLSSSRSSA